LKAIRKLDTALREYGAAMDQGEQFFTDIAATGAKFGALELSMPEAISLDDWAAVGRRLCRTDQVVKWWLGDWAAFGLGDKDQKGWRKHGQLKEFADANGVDYQTLRNLAWVSGKVELSRRRDNVEWSKHAEVAALPAKEQTKWLAKMEAEEMPRGELRRQIRQAQAAPGSNALESDGPVMRFASKALDDLVNWLKTRPEAFWDEKRRTQWKLRLAPVVKFWEGL
jgi:hypothetical protein